MKSGGVGPSSSIVPLPTVLRFGEMFASGDQAVVCLITLLTVATGMTTFHILSASAPTVAAGTLAVLLLAINLCRRRQRARQAAMAVASIAALVHIVQIPHRVPHGGHYLGTLFALALLLLLQRNRTAFNRPAPYRFEARPAQRAIAAQVVKAYGSTTRDFFKTFPDKSYFFSPRQTAFVAYRVGAGCAMALGDPVGPADEIDSMVARFTTYCDENGWRTAFYQVPGDHVDTYRRLGFNLLKIGDDAIVDLRKFAPGGKMSRSVRRYVQRLQEAGIRIVAHEPPISDQTLAAVREASDDWLRIPGRRERQFTLGRFDADYLRATPLVTAVDASGRVLAFVNIVPSSRPGEATADLIRRRTDSPNGIMEHLIATVLMMKKAERFERFNLGMVAMGGYEEWEQPSVAERTLHLLFQRMDFIFSFRGLRAFKSKFATSWEPCFMAYRHVLDLPRIAAALSRVSRVDGADDPYRRSGVVSLACVPASVTGPTRVAAGPEHCGCAQRETGHLPLRG